jgi:ComF family protein
VDILQPSAQLVFFCAVSKERFVFSVRVEDVQLGSGGPPVGRGSRRAAVRESQKVRGLLYESVATISDAFDGVLDSVLGAGWPSDCRVCAGPLNGWRHGAVCRRCFAQVKAETVAAAAETRCSVCGRVVDTDSARFVAGRGGWKCLPCRMVPPPFVRAESHARYQDEIREMLHLVKFGEVPQLAVRELGEWMAGVILRFRADAPDGLLLIAVPLHRRRRRSRGFNQSELLADAAVRHLRKSVPAWPLQLKHEVLERVKETRELYWLAPSQRRKTLDGAFRVPDKTKVQGRTVLLVDDIMTTGATARECARTLLAAGAERVFVATLARAQEEILTASWNQSKIAKWNTKPVN